MAGEKILVVDDDKDIQEIVKCYLEKDGYQIFIANSGFEAQKKMKEIELDLVLLDILLPDMDGYEVCQEIRNFSLIPIIFFSCKDEDIDKILGLNIGADDYITKPFSLGVLGAKIKAHLRRTKNYIDINQQDKILKYNDLEIDLISCQVAVNNKLVSLSAIEYKVLAFLAQNPDKVISKEELFAKIWDSPGFTDTRTVPVHISNLRKKIEQHSTARRYIHNVWGLGYKFSVDN